MVYNLKAERSASALPLSALTTRRESSSSKGADDAINEIKPLLSGLDQRSRMRVLRELRREHRKTRKKSLREMKRIEGEMRELDQKLNALLDLEKWGSGFLVFQKPTHCIFDEFRAALQDKEVVGLYKISEEPLTRDFEDELFPQINVFALEHDWSSAVGKSEEFSDGSFKLPFDSCAFEFIVSDRKVLALAINASADHRENQVAMQLSVHTLDGWGMLDVSFHRGEGWECPPAIFRLTNLIGDQIRAACISLDAEVAVSNPERIEYDGNAAHHQESLGYTFHTLSLAKRDRAPMLNGHSTGVRRRLHFRRGHWRHYESHKTWVRWCLVGDPDLGFVDKDYRL